MRLRVENGYYKFYPASTHELRVVKAKGFDVVMKKDYFTFPLLAQLEAFSIEGLLYKNLMAVETYSGRVEDLLLKNGFVYDLKSGILKKVDEINSTVDYSVSDFIWFNGFPQIGGFMKNKKRLKSFSGYWNLLGSGIITAEEVEYYAD